MLDQAAPKAPNGVQCMSTWNDPAGFLLRQAHKNPVGDFEKRRRMSPERTLQLLSNLVAKTATPPPGGCNMQTSRIQTNKFECFAVNFRAKRLCEVKKFVNFCVCGRVRLFRNQRQYCPDLDKLGHISAIFGSDWRQFRHIVSELTLIRLKEIGRV